MESQSKKRRVSKPGIGPKEAYVRLKTSGSGGAEEAFDHLIKDKEDILDREYLAENVISVLATASLPKIRTSPGSSVASGFLRSLAKLIRQYRDQRQLFAEPLKEPQIAFCKELLPIAPERLSGFLLNVLVGYEESTELLKVARYMEGQAKSLDSRVRKCNLLKSGARKSKLDTVLRSLQTFVRVLTGKDNNKAIQTIFDVLTANPTCDEKLAKLKDPALAADTTRDEKFSEPKKPTPKKKSRSPFSEPALKARAHRWRKQLRAKGHKIGS